MKLNERVNRFCTVFGLTFAIFAIVAVVTILVSCGDSVTGPTNHEGKLDPPAPAAAPIPAPAVVVTPAPETHGPVSVSCDIGTLCFFSNTLKFERKVFAVCTSIGHTNDWGSWSGVVPPGDRTLSVDLYDICDPVKIGINLCEGGRSQVQVDFNNGAEHIGHWGLGGQWLVWKPNEEFCQCVPVWTPQQPSIEITYEYGEWGECHLSQEPTPEQEGQCPGSQSRDVTKVTTTTTTFTNQCNRETRQDVVVVKTEAPPETQACETECACVEEWIEQEPVVTYGDWSACAPAEVSVSTQQPTQCDGVHSRIVTTTISETNSCTGETRVKDTRQATETEECQYDCPGGCYYNVPAGKAVCMAAPGFLSWQEQNHLCGLTPPGYCDEGFNLNPGQSVEGCLKWTGGDKNCDGVKDPK